MRTSAGQPILRLLGSLSATVGFLAWIVLAWKAISNLDGLTPQSDEGARLMVWAVTGTVLMIVGLGLLQVAAVVAQRDEPEGGTPQR